MGAQEDSKSKEKVEEKVGKREDSGEQTPDPQQVYVQIL